MKKLLMMLVAATLSVASVQAQDTQTRQHRTPEQKAEMATKRMTEELNLSNDQAAKIKAINLQYATQMKELKAKHGENKEALKADFKTLRTQKQQQIKAVLTQEQQAKLEQIRKDRKDEHGKHKGHRSDKAKAKSKGLQKDLKAPANQ